MQNTEIEVAKLSTELNNVNNRINDLSDDLKDLRKIVATKDDLSTITENAINSALTKFSDNMDAKYASKLTEKIVYSLCGLILISVLGALVGLVIIK